MRIFLGDFVGLGKGELTCKRGEEKSELDTHTPLSPLFSDFFSFEFLSWSYLAKRLYLVEGLQQNVTIVTNFSEENFFVTKKYHIVMKFIFRHYIYKKIYI